MGRFSGSLRLPQQGHIYAVSSIYSFFFHILYCRSGPLLRYATKALLYYLLNTQQLSYGMTRKAMLRPLMCPPANLMEYTHLRSLKRTNKMRTQFLTLVFRCPSSPLCAKSHLTYLRWIHTILYTTKLLLAISVIPQPLLLVFCGGKLRRRS